MVCSERTHDCNRHEKHGFDSPPQDHSPDDLLTVETLVNEIQELLPAYKKACHKLNLQHEGLSGINPERLPDFLLPFIKGCTPLNPCREIPLVFSLKNAIEDLKRLYVESYLLQNHITRDHGEELNTWFWKKTAAGRLLLVLDDVCRKSPDRMMNVISARVIMAGQPIAGSRAAGR